MDFELSDHHRLLRDTVRDFAQQEVKPVAEELDRTKSFPYEIVSKLAELDLMGIPFPPEYGGGGGGSLAHALAGGELGAEAFAGAVHPLRAPAAGTQPVSLF